MFARPASAGTSASVSTSVPVDLGGLHIAIPTQTEQPWDDDAMTEHISIVLSTERGNTCLETCLKILKRILEQPGEEKLRSIRINNPMFQVLQGYLIITRL